METGKVNTDYHIYKKQLDDALFKLKALRDREKESDSLVNKMAMENVEIGAKHKAARAQIERLQTILESAVFMMRRAGYRPVNQSNNPIEAWLFDALRELQKLKPQPPERKNLK